MSGFLKRDTKTVNPAGGVNPASSPNVSQYGWTSYDAGNVNQIIEYVNIVKGYADSAKDSADYVSDKFEEIEKFMDYIEDAYNQVGPIFSSIDVIYKDITARHTDIKNAHADILAAEQTVLPAAEQTLVNATAAAASATAAKTSETAAAASAKEAADVAEELRKGQVYRGTWNIEKNAGYPPKPDTNSVWDITLNEDSLEYFYDGQRWFWGDRLLYLKDDDQFSQIESGSTVISVNGKSGAVTLSVEELGGLPANGNPSINGNLTVSGNLTVRGNEIEFANLDVAGQLSEKGHRVYSTGYKPLASEIGALPSTGGTLTGGLQMTGDHSFRMTDTSSTNLRFTLSQGIGYLQAGHSTDDANQKMILSGINGKGLTDFQVSMTNNTNPKVRWGSTQHQIYHQGNKPTAADVGAVPAVNGTANRASGVVLLNAAWSTQTADLITGSANAPAGSGRPEFINWISWGHNGGQKMRHTLWCPADHSKTTELWFAYNNTTVGGDANHWRVYHEGYKPTAFDIGAVALNGSSVIDGTLTVNNFIRSKAPTRGGFHISGSESYAEIAPMLPASTEGIWADGLRYYGSSDWRIGNNRVYHQGFKPTATDVGALPITGGTVTNRVVVSGAHNNMVTLNTTAEAGAYLLGQKNGANDWYVGRGNNAGDVALSSYTRGNSIVLSDTKTTSARPYYVGTNEVMHKGNQNIFGLSDTKTLAIPQVALTANTWTDTGITAKSISDATGGGYLYGCVMESTGYSGGLGQYNTQIGFVTTAHSNNTNNNDSHLIPFTTTAHATNGTIFQLRWQFTSGTTTPPKLQIHCNKAGTLEMRLHVKRIM